MTEFIFEEFSTTTADDERSYFTGEPSICFYPNPNAILSPGIYRVIDGELYRIVKGIPSNLPILDLVK
jgi:hypothetical protein